MNLLYNYNSGNPFQPSFIEMFLESQMVPSLKPALEWILQIVAQKYNRLYPVLEWMDEIFYGVVFILERHYLKKYDGSFSENFYSLKRVIVTPDGKKAQLTRRHKLWCLFFLVVVPYLKTKLDKYYQANFANERRGSPEPTGTKKLFRMIYPFITVIYEGLFFLYQILYMYEMTPYYTPLLHLQGIVVKKISFEDMVRQNAKLAHQEKARQRAQQQLSFVFLVWQKITDGFSKFLDYSQYLLPTTIFFFKFLEWWTNEPRFKQSTAILPPRPEPVKRALGGLPIPSDKKICPICTKPRTNPAMSTSGFVYCYTCLFRYVEENERCPITFVPMTTEQIRKIYDEENESL
jgi:hypothetical protein